MLDVARWLAQQGLGHHAEAFAENGIAGDVLRELTDADLKELGLNLGDRKRLLKSIAALKATPDPNRLEGADPATPPISREAERRQLTVMFVDLVGSTELSAQLDPEEMGQILRDYQNVVAGEVTRFKGHIAKFMGDGVLAYFGWPRAHEDAAERAVRAASAIVLAVSRLIAPGGDALSARVGVATGLVVVGELIGAGDSAERAVVGETPNLAARLQALAAPGQVVVADATRRLLGATFTLNDIGLQDLKGFAKPVAVFVVVGERPLKSRFEARSGPRPAPMVGRNQELASLLERWAQAKAGEGQGVLLVGEAGIGKSRIVQAVLDALSSEPHTRIRYQCSPFHMDSALWPVIQQLSTAARLESADTIDAKLDRLEALLKRAVDDVGPMAPLVAALLGLEGERRYGAIELPPQMQRVRTLRVLVEQLLGLARQQPVLVVLEDAHWVDPSTLELIEQALDKVASHRVLLLITTRPDHQPKLATHPHLTRLALNRLGRAGMEAIVSRLGAERRLPNEVVDTIISRADGIPLFVEEMTKAVVESEGAAVPASLHDSLMARLDNHPEGREVAQIAAVIGREFGYPLLSAVADWPELELRAALEKLANAELLFRRGIAPEATYTFKHALVQDVAYHSLLRSRRKQLHARIAALLEEGFSDAAQSQPELLVHHFAQAGAFAKAVAYAHHASQLAGTRGAFAEAIAQSKRALDLIGNLPEETGRQQQQLALQSELADLLMATKGYAAPDVGEAFGRALELCEPVAAPRQRFMVLQGLHAHQLVKGAFRSCVRTGRETVRLGLRENDNEIYSLGHTYLGHSLVQLGKLLSARRHFCKARDRLEGATEVTAFASALRDPYQELLVFPSINLLLLGYPDQARRHMGEAIARVQAGPAAQKLAHTLSYSLRLCYLLRDDCEVERQAAIMGQVSDKFGLAMYSAVATSWQGWVAAKQGRQGQAIASLERGLSAYKATGALWMVPLTMLLLADVHRFANDASSSLTVLDEALDMMARIDARWLEAEIHRRRGEMLLSSGRESEADEALSVSLTIARRQQARWWELRTAADLARLRRIQGRHYDAWTLLASICRWFNEGFDTPDLKDARALLEELA